MDGGARDRGARDRGAEKANLTNRGFPLHLNTMFLPSGISSSLISIFAMALTSAAAAIVETNLVTIDFAAYTNGAPMAPGTQIITG